MTKSDVKDQIVHSLGTIAAIRLVYEVRMSSYLAPTVQQVHELIEEVLADFERGFVLQIKGGGI